MCSLNCSLISYLSFIATSSSLYTQRKPIKQVIGAKQGTQTSFVATEQFSGINIMKTKIDLFIHFINNYYYTKYTTQEQI